MEYGDTYLNNERREDAYNEYINSLSQEKSSYDDKLADNIRKHENQLEKVNQQYEDVKNAIEAPGEFLIGHSTSELLKYGKKRVEDALTKAKSMADEKIKQVVGTVDKLQDNLKPGDVLEKTNLDMPKIGDKLPTMPETPNLKPLSLEGNRPTINKDLITKKVEFNKPNVDANYSDRFLSKSRIYNREPVDILPDEPETGGGLMSRVGKLFGRSRRTLTARSITNDDLTAMRELQTMAGGNTVNLASEAPDMALDPESFWNNVGGANPRALKELRETQVPISGEDMITNKFSPFYDEEVRRGLQNFKERTPEEHIKFKAEQLQREQRIKKSINNNELPDLEDLGIKNTQVVPDVLTRADDVIPDSLHPMRELLGRNKPVNMEIFNDLDNRQRSNMVKSYLDETSQVANDKLNKIININQQEEEQEPIIQQAADNSFIHGSNDLLDNATENFNENLAKNIPKNINSQVEDLSNPFSDVMNYKPLGQVSEIGEDVAKVATSGLEDVAEASGAAALAEGGLDPLADIVAGVTGIGLLLGGLFHKKHKAPPVVIPPPPPRPINPSVQMGI